MGGNTEFDESTPEMNKKTYKASFYHLQHLAWSEFTVTMPNVAQKGCGGTDE